MVPDSSVPDAPPVERTLLPHKRRRYSCFRFAARGLPQKTQSLRPPYSDLHNAPSRAAWFKIALPDTPMLEDASGAKKNADVRSVSVLVVWGTCRVEHTSRFIPGLHTSCRAARHGSDASCLDAPEFKDVCGASKPLQQELKYRSWGVEALPPA
jgi:hypothetical protein